MDVSIIIDTKRYNAKIDVEDRVYNDLVAQGIDVVEAVMIQLTKNAVQQWREDTAVDEKAEYDEKGGLEN